MDRQADGVVVAEAALIRLGLTHLNRVTLPGKTTPLQGQLAILAREGDHAMKVLFSNINTYQLI
jgi:hydroxymethylbilane synthase